MSRLARDGTAEPVPRDQILRCERGQGHIHFPCSADHEQDWQPYPVDPYSCYMCDHTYKQSPTVGLPFVLSCRTYGPERTIETPMSMITAPWKFPRIKEADPAPAGLDIDSIVDDPPSRHPSAPVSSLE